MPSARDLLQQADALMRNNRSVGTAGGDDTVPILTDVAIPGRASRQSAGRDEDIPVLTRAVVVPEADFDLTIPSDRSAAHAFPPTQMESLLPISEMPAIPQIGDDDSIIAMRRRESRIERSAAVDESIESRPKWLEADLLDSPDAASTANASGTPADLPAAAESQQVSPQAETSQEEPSIPIVSPAESQSTPEAAAAPPSGPAASADEVAETVYFQVLQNLDLYTERALQQHLSEHLAPIIDKASRELVATLNAELGALMRQFVADAIEKQLGVRPPAEPPRRDS